MVLGLFKRKREVKDQTEQKKQNNELEDAVYNALMKGLDEMEKKGIDRIVISLYESKPSESAKKKQFFDIDKDTQYYPFEMLDEEEQKMILDGKSYKVISLVMENVGNIFKYPNKGIEVYIRTHIYPLLYGVTPESRLNYITEGGIYSGENIKKFVEIAVKNGWTPQDIEQKIKYGIQEYHKITKRLMEKAGVYKALERMEKRKNSPLEEIFQEIRNNIYNKNKNY